MRKFNLILVLLCVVAPLAVLNGCGGGGGSGGGGSSTPSPTRTPTPAGVGKLLVKLQDSTGLPVDGLVTVGAARQGTVAGEATFTGLAVGAIQVSAEVNGQTTVGTATVAGSGTTTFTLTISGAVTPLPTTSPPPTPF